MGVFRVVGFLALVSACDKGQLAPAKGSAQPLPAPLPSPDPAPVPIDAMSIDEQLLNGKTPDLWVRACNDTGQEMTQLEWHDRFKEPLLPVGWCTAYRPTDRAYSYTYAAFRAAKVDYVIQPIDYMGETPLAAGHWSFHIKHLDPAHKVAEIHAESDKLTKDPESSVRVCNDTTSDLTFQIGPISRPDVKQHACTDYIGVSRADSATKMTLDANGKPYSSSPYADAIHALPPGQWSYHITKLGPDDRITYDARPDMK